MALIKSSPGQQWPGFSFALHPLRVQGFYFALLQCIHIQAFTAAFISSMQLYRQHLKTAHRALQALFLQFIPFYRHRYQTGKSGYNTACATLEHLPAPGRLAPIPDTTAMPGHCADQRSRSIIIMYIRAQGCAPVIDPCQTVQHIANHASPAGAAAEGSASPPVQGQPGGDLDTFRARRLAI